MQTHKLLHYKSFSHHHQSITLLSIIKLFFYVSDTKEKDNSIRASVIYKPSMFSLSPGLLLSYRVAALINGNNRPLLKFNVVLGAWQWCCPV